jgi:hypothetical protein
MAESKTGQINIMAKEINGKASGEIRDDAKTIKNETGGNFYQSGGEGGVVHDKNEDRKEIKESKNESENADFDIKLSINKQDNTFVPLGIPDFNKKVENQFIKFKVIITGEGINHWQLDIKNKDEIIYTAHSATDELKEVVVLTKSKKHTKTSDEAKLEDTKPKRFWPAGEYMVTWNGFDKNEIYKSNQFIENNLTATIKGTGDSKDKTSEAVKLQFEREEASWVDVVINKKTKRIDVTLRVNLKDGGTKGLNTWNNTRYNGTPGSVKEFHDWDKIPESVLKSKGKPVIEVRTRSYDELKQLAIEGLKNHWGRNSKNSIGNNVDIDGEKYEVFIDPIVTTENSMKEVSVTFNTNTNWGRSNNPGCINGFKSYLANAAKYIPYVPLDATIYYNVGYLNFSYKFESEILLKQDWGYTDGTAIYNGRVKENMEDKEFSFTAAHELGHSIIKEYAVSAGGSVDYSYEHKGSSGYSSTKPVLEGGFEYPSTGEIDLMKYYNNDPRRYDYDRVIADEIDVLGLIWLAKIKIK